MSKINKSLSIDPILALEMEEEAKNCGKNFSEYIEEKLRRNRDISLLDLYRDILMTNSHLSELLSQFQFRSEREINKLDEKKLEIQKSLLSERNLILNELNQLERKFFNLDEEQKKQVMEVDINDPVKLVALSSSLRMNSDDQSRGNRIFSGEIVRFRMLLDQSRHFKNNEEVKQ